MVSSQQLVEIYKAGIYLPSFLERKTSRSPGDEVALPCLISPEDLTQVAVRNAAVKDCVTYIQLVTFSCMSTYLTAIIRHYHYNQLHLEVKKLNIRGFT